MWIVTNHKDFTIRVSSFILAKYYYGFFQIITPNLCIERA